MHKNTYSQLCRSVLRRSKMEVIAAALLLITKNLASTQDNQCVQLHRAVISLITKKAIEMKTLCTV